LNPHITIDGVSRYEDVNKINALINHESVNRWTTFGENVDVSGVMESGRALFLGDEHGGFLVFNEGEGVWSVHTQFLKGHRSNALEKAKNGIAWMFVNTDCIALVTFVQYENLAAKNLSLASGMTFVRDDEQMGKKGEIFCINIKDWVRLICQ